MQILPEVYELSCYHVIIDIGCMKFNYRIIALCGIMEIQLKYSVNTN